MVYAATCVGKHHSTSEDTVVVGTQVFSETRETLFVPDTGFICVADGVGGNRGGADASLFVCSALSEAGILHPSELEPFLVGINHKLLTMAKKKPALTSMATTLTGIYKLHNVCWLIHVGNTRAFVKQGKYLKQSTPDHTTSNWMKSSGHLAAAEICNQNEITNCFGGNDPALLAKLIVMRFQQFSLLLLTSDGVHEYVDVDQLENILNGEGSYSDKCADILRAAKDAGSEDDMTAVIICNE